MRDGLDLDLHLPWDDVRSVEIRRAADEPKSPSIVETDAGTALAVRIPDATNILIVLEGPTRVVLPGSAPKGGEHDVEVVRLWADDPKTFLAAVARHIG